MSKPNQLKDVFLHIDLCGGDESKCWPWKHKTGLSGRDARPYFSLKGKRCLAYRVAFAAFHARELSDIKPLRHTCDNQVCCNPYHLVEGTHQENMDDMKDRERHGLPHHTVKAIKRLLKRGTATHQEIGELFGVSRQLIGQIANDVLYKHVPNPTSEEMAEHRESDKERIARIRLPKNRDSSAD